MSASLHQRIAVVTGASAGIGESIALDLARRGAAVVVNARRVKRLEELVARIESDGGRAVVCPGDASQRQTIDAMLDAAESSFNAPADIVIANAGRGLAGSPLTSDDAEWDEMLRTNVLGVAHLVRAAGARLVELAPADDPLASARDLVVLGSTVGRHISPFSSMYGSTKFAVHSIAEAARRELAPRGVRVSLIEPGIVRTEFQSVAGYDEDTFGDFMETIGPVLTPDDVARLVGFIVEQPAHVHVNDVVIRPTRQEYP